MNGLSLPRLLLIGALMAATAGVSAPGCANVTAGASTLTFRFVPVTGAGRRAP